jgi:hypothetical protein
MLWVGPCGLPICGPLCLWTVPPQDKGAPTACQACCTPFSQEHCVLPYSLKCGHLHCGPCMRSVVEFQGDTTAITVQCFVCSVPSAYNSLAGVPSDPAWAEAVDAMRWVPHVGVGRCGARTRCWAGRSPLFLFRPVDCDLRRLGSTQCGYTAALPAQSPPSSPFSRVRARARWNSVEVR